MDRYEHLKDIGAGNFGVARLMRDKKTKELVAIKYIERGDKIDHNVEREIINHRSLRHPNIVRFKEVCLTNTHLAIVMEYAAGGELFDRICAAGRFTEDEARFFFQQLISGVSYCHAMEICHRDLKLENTLLDGSPAPRLKICDFGYSKSALLNSAPKSIVGTPAYIAPEVLSSQGYDGKTADVWSCGVTLYVMLVGAYPFEDADDPKNFRRTIERIVNVQYTIPSYIKISQECRHLLSCIFVANPAKRITIPEIMRHPWFLRNLPRDLYLGSDPNYNQEDPDHPLQSIDEVKRILKEARTKPQPHPQPAQVQPQTRNPETQQLQQKTQQQQPVYMQQRTQEPQLEHLQPKTQRPQPVHLQQKTQQLPSVHLQQKTQQAQPIRLQQHTQQAQPWPQLVIEQPTIAHQEPAVAEEEDEIEYFECSDVGDFESNEPMRDQDSSAEPMALQSSKKSLLSLISFGDWIPQKLSINNFRLTSWFR